MDIKDKRILVLGGFGLVGQAVIKRMMGNPSSQNAEAPAHIVITSIRQSEAESAVNHFEKLYSGSGTTFEPLWGNIFARDEWKDLAREAILKDPENRRQLIDDILGDLTEAVLKSNALYAAIEWARPDAIIDCINTSTALAYQDLFSMGHRVSDSIRIGSEESGELTERLLASLYIPQLIRHIQILHHALIDFNVRAYIKIGTSGTGGMGLNIPFTHSEERPSRMLLAKSSLAGAHSLLLWIMARSPRTAEIVKEIKPTATIGWKEIKYGPLRKSGKPIELEFVEFEKAEILGRKLDLIRSKPKNETENREDGQILAHSTLEGVYIDTGENGIFSKGEFETISALGQMEMVTPEEISENVYRELTGASTGKDIVAALDASTMGPSYRAGYLRESALRMMTALEEETKTSSVAYEMLGPPRLAKLLFEAHLLKRAGNNFDGVLAQSTEELSNRAEQILKEDSLLRSHIISIGIPILLADGKRLIRGSHIKIPTRGPNSMGGISVELSDEKLAAWSHDGWVDLRQKNMKLWQQRLALIREEAMRLGNGTGSEPDRSPAYWDDFKSLNEGRLAAWIFIFEEGGERVKR